MGVAYVTSADASCLPVVLLVNRPASRPCASKITAPESSPREKGLLARSLRGYPVMAISLVVHMKSCLPLTTSRTIEGSSEAHPRVRPDIGPRLPRKMHSSPSRSSITGRLSSSMGTTPDRWSRPSNGKTNFSWFTGCSLSNFIISFGKIGGCAPFREKGIVFMSTVFCRSGCCPGTARLAGRHACMSVRKAGPRFCVPPPRCT